jgi:hypothetical protein
MKVLNDGVVQLKKQNTKNAQVIITANNENTKTLVGANTKTAKAILDATNDLNKKMTETIEDNGALILEAIEDACGNKAGNRQLLLSSVAVCNGRDREVSCGFNSAHVSSNKKTLFVEEGIGRVSTGLFVNVKVSTKRGPSTPTLLCFLSLSNHLFHQDPCSQLVEVQISVTSNEFEESPTAVLATKVDDERNSFKQLLVRVLCVNSRCHEGSASFCVGDESVKNRFYSIKVSVTDRNNSTNVHDTCRVVVMPKSKPGTKSKTGTKQELRGQQSRGLSKRDEEKLVMASSGRFPIASISFSQKVDLN